MRCWESLRFKFDFFSSKHQSILQNAQYSILQESTGHSSANFLLSQLTLGVYVNYLAERGSLERRLPTGLLFVFFSESAAFSDSFNIIEYKWQHGLFKNIMCMFHPVWIHSASTLDQIAVWSLCTHTHALQTREEMQMPPHLFLDGSVVLYLLNLNKRRFHCCSNSTDRRVAPSVPSEAYDYLFWHLSATLWWWNQSVDSEWWALFSLQKERFCVFVCDNEPEGVWEGSTLFSEFCLAQRLSGRWKIMFNPETFCMCSALCFCLNPRRSLSIFIFCKPVQIV